ncbi:MerR family DNA-binding protein [Devosia sp.]|uniref:MerR family DNA-binding protein n=1 Tax=Devosia sp. TaxID=1871048 RepID=UPI002EE25D9F
MAHARAMGSLMESVKVMLRLSRHAGSVCADLDGLAQGRLAEVGERIEWLRRLRGGRAAMLESHRHGTVGECRIIEVLSDHDECATEH